MSDCKRVEFRVLDLGAHDGFVTNWLARQLPECDIVVDGMELNSHGVAEFNRRAFKDGIEGRCARGLAEDASAHFDVRSYDAVVAFELIEHVPDVNAFLYECERMCNDGGRVYISTPNGTFGTGMNPHHLHCWTASQLYDLIRRRGKVVDLMPGADGVTVICYEPYFHWGHLRPELAIYCGGGWEPWHPMDIETKGLGGSETAAIKLAVALSDKYTVTVYGEISETVAYKQVLFKHHSAFDPMEPRECIISSRIPEVADNSHAANKLILWMHDTDYGPRLTKERYDKFDAIMVLSEWHRQHVHFNYGHFDPEGEKLLVTSNAIEPSYFAKRNHRRHDNVALYTSSPDRGLDLILKLWPRVREQVPDAELHYCYSSVYDKVADTNRDIAEFRNKVARLSDQPGVHSMGSLTQPMLAQAMQQAGVWLAPSFNTVHHVQFFETYCIGAQEAAAAGCCGVLSDWGALSERQEMFVNSVSIPLRKDCMCGGLPPGEASGAGDLCTCNFESFDEDAWVSGIVNAMTQVTHEPSPLALSLTWDVVASDFDSVIVNGLATITG